jgi:hypothetical protein
MLDYRDDDIFGRQFNKSCVNCSADYNRNGWVDTYDRTVYNSCKGTKNLSDNFTEEYTIQIGSQTRLNYTNNRTSFGVEGGANISLYNSVVNCVYNCSLYVNNGGTTSIDGYSQGAVQEGISFASNRTNITRDRDGSLVQLNLTANSTVQAHKVKVVSRNETAVFYMKDNLTEELINHSRKTNKSILIVSNETMTSVGIVNISDDANNTVEVHEPGVVVRYNFSDEIQLDFNETALNRSSKNTTIRIDVNDSHKVEYRRINRTSKLVYNISMRPTVSLNLSVVINNRTFMNLSSEKAQISDRTHRITVYKRMPLSRFKDHIPRPRLDFFGKFSNYTRT